jgi:surfeit locus 1 family protein
MELSALTDMSSSTTSSSRRSPVILGIWVTLLLVLTALLIGLGTWQIERLHWKLDLIARVNQRVHAAPQPAPGPTEWAAINADGYEYRHVQLTGTLLNDSEAQVYASTDLGPGYWVMTPLKAADGTITFVNLGFVPTEKRDPKTRSAGDPSGPVTVTGLLRMNEPKGTLLRSNVPDADRWYSRDIEAIAAKRGLGAVAPYFVDADAAANPGGLPVGGLTQIVFPNNHLVYAITWYCLALMTAGLAFYLIYSDRSRTRIRSQND